MDNKLKEKGSSMKDVMSQNLYQDRRAWRTLFVDWQEFIFLTGDWLERETEVLWRLGAGLLPSWLFK